MWVFGKAHRECYTLRHHTLKQSDRALFYANWWGILVRSWGNVL